MMTDLVSVYNKYKFKTLNEYINLISNIISVDHKKIIGNKKRTLDMLEGIVEIYNNKYLFSGEVIYDLSKIFIDSPYIDEYNLSKEINAISEYFMKNNMIFDLIKNEKEIILMAVYIQMAYKLDEFASLTSYKIINYNNEIFSMLEHYHKINYIFLIDEGKKNTRDLIELVKNKSKIEKELYNNLTNKNSFNKYIKISEDKDIFITQYNYYIEELEKYDSVQSNKIYLEKNIDDSYNIISAEIASITILKQIQARKESGIFLIPVKKKFFTKEKNIRDYKKILESKITNRCIKLLINYNEVNDNLIHVLNTNKLDYYIYCNKGAILKELSSNIKYIFSKEFMKNNQIIVTNKENIIVESINIFMEDDDFIFRRERENY